MKTHLLWTAIFVLLFSLGCSGGKKKTGTLCQADNDCTGGGLCLGGTCVALTACTSQSECGNGVCSQGYCWSEACGGDGAQSCPDYAECLEGYCVRKSSETDATDGKDTSSENECNVDTDCSAKLGTLGSCEKPSCLNGVCLKVKKAEGDKLEVIFENGGVKKVIAGFVERG